MRYISHFLRQNVQDFIKQIVENEQALTNLAKENPEDTPEQVEEVEKKKTQVKENINYLKALIQEIAELPAQKTE